MAGAGPASVKPFTRWTADTEQAFLLALRLTGQVRLAAAEIGRSVQTAYKRRERSADFAARWAATVAAAQAEWAAAHRTLDPDATEPAANRTRHDGWTEARRKLFLRVLGETGVLAQAAERARISLRSVQMLRKSNARFDADCIRALHKGGVTLEQAAYTRAVDGWDEPIVHAGQIVGYKRRFSDPLLRLLLQERGATRAAGAAAPRRATREQTDAAILRQLEALAERTRRGKWAEMIAWADDMMARGLAP